MSLFYFNTHDGITILDKEGTEFDTWEEARLDAIALAGQILKDNPKRIALGHDWRMEVTDETGLVLFRLDFQVMESPALSASSSSKPFQLRN
jgi:hypothetical protein